MKTQARKRFTLLIRFLLVIAGVLLACLLGVKYEQRQHAMNRELIASLAQGDFKRALNLVEAGADPNTRVIPSPPLTWQELLQQLLHRSSMPTNPSPTAFMAACGHHWVNDSNDNLAMWNAIPEGALHDPMLIKVARAMLLQGANVNASDKYGRTALMAASHQGLLEQMALLLEHGAFIDHQDDNGDTALHVGDLKNPQVVKLLLKYHANPNLRDKPHIVFSGRAEDKNGITPLGLAVRFPAYSSPETIRLLKAAGAIK